MFALLDNTDNNNGKFNIRRNGDDKTLKKQYEFDWNKALINM